MKKNNSTIDESRIVERLSDSSFVYEDIDGRFILFVKDREFLPVVELTKERVTEGDHQSNHTVGAWYTEFPVYENGFLCKAFVEKYGRVTVEKL